MLRHDLNFKFSRISSRSYFQLGKFSLLKKSNSLPSRMFNGMDHYNHMKILRSHKKNKEIEKSQGLKNKSFPM